MQHGLRFAMRKLRNILRPVPGRISGHYVAASSKATVLYSNGKEVVDSSGAKGKKRKAANGYLLTYGVFGPLLGAVTDAIASGWRWSHWEVGAGGPHAVFRYEIPAERSRYQVGVCCLPDGDGNHFFRRDRRLSRGDRDRSDERSHPSPGSGGRPEINHTTCPVSNIMIEYGPVEIGGKTYICPVRSVSISRGKIRAHL